MEIFGDYFCNNDFLGFSPVVTGYIMMPTGSVFSFRSNLNWIDYPSYFSYINQVKDGHYFFKMLSTSENQSISVSNPFWLGVGLFAKMFSLSAGVAYHIVRLLLTPVLLIVAYYLVALFFQEEFKRKACFVVLLSFSIFQMWASLSFSQNIYESPHYIAALSLCNYNNSVAIYKVN